MKRWTAFLAACALALTLSVPAFAAPETGARKAAAKAARGQKGGRRKPGGKGRPAAGLKRLQAALEKLNLSPDQRSRINALMGTTRTRLRAIRQGPGTPERKRAQTRPVMQAARRQLTGILTPAQQKQLREELRKGRKPGKKGPKKTGSRATSTPSKS